MKISSGTKGEIRGHLGSDPELREVAGGSGGPTQLCQLRIAVNPKRDVTEWYRVVVWGPLALVCEKELHKGDAVKIEGHMRVRVQEEDLKAKPPKHYREFFEIVGKKVARYVTEDTVRFLRTEGGDEVDVTD